MSQDLFPLACVISWLGLAYKGMELRRDPRSPALLSICGLLYFLGLCDVLSWPAAEGPINAIAHVPLSELLSRDAAVAGAFCAQALVLYLDSPAAGDAVRGIRSRLYIAIGVVFTGLIGDFVNATTPARDRLVHTVVDTCAAGSVVAYMAFADIDVLRLSVRYARTAARRSLRWGVWLLCIGGLVNLGYVGHEVGALALSAVGAPASDARGNALFMTCGTISTTLAMVVPSLGPGVVEVVRWPHRWRRYRRLHPVWLVVYQALPQIALEPPRDPTHDRLIFRGLYGALYRRVIEIRDAVLCLAPLVGDVALRGRAEARGQGLDQEAAAAVADAITIAVGIRELEGAHPAVGAASRRFVRTSVEGPSVADLDAEAERLVMVGRALAESKIVIRVLYSYIYGQPAL